MRYRRQCTIEEENIAKSLYCRCLDNILYYWAWLPSNLRPTKRECVLLVTRVHFQPTWQWSIRLVPPYLKPHAICKHHGSMFDRTGVITNCIAGIGIVDLFGSYDLDLDLMAFIYELEPKTMERYTACANMNFLRQGFRKLPSDRHTDRQDQSYYTRRFTEAKNPVIPVARYSRIVVTSAVRQRQKTSISRNGKYWKQRNAGAVYENCWTV